MPKRRLGVVLLLPPPVAAEVDGLRRALGDGGLARIPPHITLVPPVNVREDQLADALRVLRSAAAATKPFRLLLGPPDTFLPANPTLYLSVSGDVDALGALRDRVFSPPLERQLTYPYVPHATIADEAEPARINAALTALATYSIEASFGGVHLLEETASRVWSPVAEARFGRPVVVGQGGLALELAVGSQLDAEASAFHDQEWARYSADDYGEGLPSDVPLTITGRRDGRVVGVATGEITGETAYLGRLIVRADVRNEGIGAALLAAFESEAAAAGCHRLTLRTQADGPAAAFYRRHGWRDLYELPAWRHGRDFVQMERKLTS